LKKFTLPALACLLLFFVYQYFFSAPAITNSSPSGKNIICFGDSLTYGTGAGRGMDYPAQLSRLISRPVINAGTPGDTTASALSRLERAVLSQDPRIVLITLGGNDLKNRVPKERAFHNLKTIITAIQKRGALVVVGGIDIPLYGRGFGAAYAQVCGETGALLVPNIFEGVFGKKNLMSDPIHPNAAGYTLIARKFYRAIKPYL